MGWGNAAQVEDGGDPRKQVVALPVRVDVRWAAQGSYEGWNSIQRRGRSIWGFAEGTREAVEDWLAMEGWAAPNFPAGAFDGMSEAAWTCVSGGKEGALLASWEGVGRCERFMRVDERWGGSRLAFAVFEPGQAQAVGKKEDAERLLGILASAQEAVVDERMSRGAALGVCWIPVDGLRGFEPSTVEVLDKIEEVLRARAERDGIAREVHGAEGRARSAPRL